MGFGSELPLRDPDCPSGARDRGCFDVVFQKRSSVGESPIEWPGHPRQEASRYANDPVRGKVLGMLAPQLRGYLSAQLPEYLWSRHH